MLLKLDLCLCVCVCVCVCPVSNKVLGEKKTIENVVYLFIYGVYQGTWLKHIGYAESEFRTIEFVICNLLLFIWI